MDKTPRFHPNPDLKLMDQVCEVLRYYHYAYRTEQSYCQWIVRYIRFHGGKTHPARLGASDVERFLSDLVSRLKVSAATHGREVLRSPIFSCFAHRDQGNRHLQSLPPSYLSIRGNPT